MLVALKVHVRQQNFHTARTFAAQHIRFVLDNALLVAQVVLGRRMLFHVFAMVEYCELCA